MKLGQLMCLVFGARDELSTVQECADVMSEWQVGISVTRQRQREGSLGRDEKYSMKLYMLNVEHFNMIHRLCRHVDRNITETCRVHGKLFLALASGEVLHSKLENENVVHECVEARR